MTEDGTGWKLANEAAAQSVASNVYVAKKACFFADSSQVSAHRLFAESKLSGNLLNGLSFGDACEDFQFPG